jgi:hypothetical protein
MAPLVLAALPCAQPDETVVRVKLEAIALREAERLNGKAVVATFTVGKPCFTWGEGKGLRTVTAPAGGGTERTVVLKGNRLHDADRGARVTVVGTLRVIRHPAGTVGSMQLGEWTEIRIVE